MTEQKTPASVVERLQDRVSRDADHGDGFIGTLPVSLLAEAAALIERLSAAQEDAEFFEKAWQERVKDCERLSAEREGLREALKPFAALDGFDKSIMIEVCEPHPDNPSPRIQPMPASAILRARAALTQGESRQTGASEAQINHLSQTLDMSPGSVRESLARLQAKGLVRTLPAAPTPAGGEA
jgi:hypothetical protein